MRFDRDSEVLFVMNTEGKEMRYAKGAVLPSAGAIDVDIAFDGTIIDFNEPIVRLLPERIIVHRHREKDQFGRDMAGSKSEQNEYLRDTPT
jgi:hypothetical protein